MTTLERDASALISRAATTNTERLCMTSAFGLNGCVLIHLVYGVCKLRVPVLFVDTGYMFAETLDTRDRLCERYDLHLVEGKPEGDLPDPPALGCCKRRKVEPMQALIESLAPTALLTGRGRFQAVTRRQLPEVEANVTPARFNPLVAWSQQDVELYIKRNRIPYNPLYDRGYHSIGCWPCTRAVRPGEDVRAGRWDGLARVECGLWNGRTP